MNGFLQRLRRHWRLWAGAAVVLAVYAAAGFLWVPHLARNAIASYVEKDLGRHIAIGKISFNPFTLTARVSNFSLMESDNAPIVSFAALTVNAELSSIVYGAFAFKELHLEQPDLHVIVNADGTLNLAQLRPKSAPEKATPRSELPRIRIGLLRIVRGHLHVEDRSRPKPFATTLEPIEFTLTQFRSEPKFENVYRFTAATDDNERLDWSGEFSLDPLGSSGKFAIGELRATTIAAYLQDQLPFDLRSGMLDVQGKYELTLRDQLNVKIQLPIVSVRDVSIAERGGSGAAPLIAIPQLTLADSSLSLLERSIKIGKVHLDAPRVELWREADGSLNLAKLVPPEPPGATPAIAQSTESTMPWHVDVATLAIEGGTINAQDRSVKPAATLALAPFNLTAQGYSNSAKSTFNVDADIAVNERGHLTIGGSVSLEPVTADLRIALRDFDLSVLQGYVAASTDMTLQQGRIGTQGNLRYAAEPARGQPQLKFSGDIAIADLLTKDNALQEDFIKWQALTIAGFDFQRSAKQSALDHLNITRIHAKKPYGRVIIGSDSTLNVVHVLNPQRAGAATPSVDGKNATDNSTQPFPIRIRTVEIEDGTTSFADYSVKPAFAAEIGELRGTLDGLSSARDARAQIQLSGNVDRYAPVSITGEANFLAKDIYADIAMSFRNMELTLFNPYSGKFAGYNITKGKLSTELKYKIDNRKLDATHHIVVDQLEFGAATDSKDAVSLPVKLAVALLKDRHGVINLDLPVNGSLDDPAFRIGPIVWQVLKNTLEKIVTAPFKLLGSLFGGGEELAFIDFAPGAATLAAEQAEKLNKLRLAMVERPQLKLDIPLHASAPSDGAAFAHAALEDAVAPLLKNKPDRLVALAAIYTKEFAKAPVYPESDDKKADVVVPRTRFLEETLLEKFTPTPAQIDELARQRGTTVQGALLSSGEIAAERVFLSNRASEPEKNQAIVRMELKLE